MRLSDIATTPVPGRPTDARHGKQVPAGERAFGDLLEKKGVRGDNGDFDIELEAIAPTDLPVDILDFDVRKTDRTPPDEREHTNMLRMPERVSIDWLSLRVAGHGASEPPEQSGISEKTRPDLDLKVSGEAGASVTDDEGAIADRQIAALPARRLDRTGDGETGGRTARDPLASPRTAVPDQFQDGEQNADSVEPAGDGRTVKSLRTTVAPSVERLIPDAQHQPPAQIGAVSAQTILAPSLELQTPARSVLAVLSEQAPEMARSIAATSMQHLTAEPMRILRIQLHPLELGMVTAKLSLQGGAMAVELQTETRDAAARLAADSQDIVKSLRGLGIEVDRVTVTQSPSSPAHQNDAQAGNFDRNERFAGDMAGGQDTREQGRQAAGGGTANFEERDFHAPPDRSGVFI